MIPIAQPAVELPPPGLRGAKAVVDVVKGNPQSHDVLHGRACQRRKLRPEGADALDQRHDGPVGRMHLRAQGTAVGRRVHVFCMYRETFRFACPNRP